MVVSIFSICEKFRVVKMGLSYERMNREIIDFLWMDVGEKVEEKRREHVDVEGSVL